MDYNPQIHKEEVDYCDPSNIPSHYLPPDFPGVEMCVECGEEEHTDEFTKTCDSCAEKLWGNSDEP